MADVLDPNISTTCGRSSTAKPCFVAGQFADGAAQTDFGNRPRNSFRGPEFFGLDTSLYRMLRVGEKTRLFLGASAYNLLNHPNFANPNGDAASSG